MDKIFAALAAPFPPDRVHFRPQGKPSTRNGRTTCLGLCYIDARDVMDRLDETVGPGGWQSEFTETPKGRLICRLSLFIDGQWVTKSDGAGDTDVEGEKGALSDALKRAAVSWGIGRYLYRAANVYADCIANDKGGFVRWTDEGRRLLMSKLEKPQPAVDPEGVDPLDELEAFNASVAAAIRSIEREQDPASLAAYWTDLNKTQRAVAADGKVIAAKDKRKAELMKEAA